MMGLHIIALGNVVDGFTFIGPFKTGDDAVGFAERNYPDDEWHVAPLVKITTEMEILT